MMKNGHINGVPLHILKEAIEVYNANLGGKHGGIS